MRESATQHGTAHAHGHAGRGTRSPDLKSSLPKIFNGLKTSILYQVSESVNSQAKTKSQVSSQKSQDFTNGNATMVLYCTTGGTAAQLRS